MNAPRATGLSLLQATSVPHESQLDSRRCQLPRPPPAARCRRLPAGDGCKLPDPWTRRRPLPRGSRALARLRSPRSLPGKAQTTGPTVPAALADGPCPFLTRLPHSWQGCVSPAPGSQAAGLRRNCQGGRRAGPKPRAPAWLDMPQPRRTPPGPALPRQQTTLADVQRGLSLVWGARARALPPGPVGGARTPCPQQGAVASRGCQAPSVGRSRPQAHGPEPYLGCDHPAGSRGWNRGRRSTAMRPHAGPSQPGERCGRGDPGPAPRSPRRSPSCWALGTPDT